MAEIKQVRNDNATPVNPFAASIPSELARMTTNVPAQLSVETDPALEEELRATVSKFVQSPHGLPLGPADLHILLLESARYSERASAARGFSLLKPPSKFPDLDRILELGKGQPVAAAVISATRAFFGADISDLEISAELSGPTVPKPMITLALSESERSEWGREHARDKSVQDAIGTRRFLNVLAAGAGQALCDQLLFQAAPKSKITPEYLQEVGRAWSLNASAYWDPQFENTKPLAEVHGQAWLDLTVQPPAVRALGIDLPSLAYETARGVVHRLGLHALPSDGLAQAYVIHAGDDPIYHRTDFRLGAAVWNRFMATHAHPEGRALSAAIVQVVGSPIENITTLLRAK